MNKWNENEKKNTKNYAHPNKTQQPEKKKEEAKQAKLSVAYT